MSVLFHPNAVTLESFAHKAYTVISKEVICYATQLHAVDECTLERVVKRAIGLAVTTLSLSPLTTATHCKTQPASKQVRGSINWVIILLLLFYSYSCLAINLGLIVETLFNNVTCEVFGVLYC